MTTEWTKESMAQAIAEEGLDFVVRELNSHAQLLEALRSLISAVDGNGPVGSLHTANENARVAIKAAEEA